MTAFYPERKARVAVVDPAGTVRQQISDAVKQLGFEDIQGFSSVKDTIQYLEAETLDWILTPLMAEESENTLQLLKLTTEYPELKQVRISLLVEMGEAEILPNAYELGLLSHHPKPFTKESLGEELTSLFETIDGHEGDMTLTSARYLRQHLANEKDYEALISLEKSLLSLYPGRVDLLMHLVEPQYNFGQETRARKTLQQIQILDPSREDQVKSLRRRLFSDEAGMEEDNTEESGPNALGIETCILVDSDDTVSQAVEDTLKEMSVPNVVRFTDGQSAWEYLESNPEPDLIIMEWRIPKLTGPMLVQRLRNKGYHGVPVVVLSSLLTADDLPLVREMGVAQLISKPFNKEIFLPSLVWTVQQERTPTDHQVMERKVRSHLQTGEFEEAKPLLKKFLDESTVTVGRKNVIQCETAFYKGDYNEARDRGIEALRTAGNSLYVLNILGKIFMHYRDFDSALKCLKKAQELSPKNLERICQIAEAHSELGDTESANEAMDHANVLDPDAEVAKETKAKCALNEDDPNTARNIMKQLDSLADIVAYMNNKAVAHSKCGMLDDAVSIYQKTADSIPEKSADVKAVVSYNLALAHVKAGRSSEALPALDTALECGKTKVQKKASSLKSRINKALEAGEELQLRLATPKDSAESSRNAASQEKPQSDEVSADQTTVNRQGESNETEASSTQGVAEEASDGGLLGSLEAQPGEACCFLVFHHPGGQQERAGDLLANGVRFHPREAIERGESFGGAQESKSA